MDTCTNNKAKEFWETPRKTSGRTTLSKDFFKSLVKGEPVSDFKDTKKETLLTISENTLALAES